MTWIILLEFLFGEKEVPEVFWVGIAFFFSFWLSWETGISGLDLVSVDNTHRSLRPVVCFSGIFFFRQNRVFIGDSASGALGLRSRRFFTGCTWIRNIQQKKNQKKSKTGKHFPITFSGRPDINNATTCLTRVTISHFMRRV